MDHPRGERCLPTADRRSRFSPAHLRLLPLPKHLALKHLTLEHLTLEHLALKHLP